MWEGDTRKMTSGLLQDEMLDSSTVLRLEFTACTYGCRVEQANKNVSCSHHTPSKTSFGTVSQLFSHSQQPSGKKVQRRELHSKKVIPESDNIVVRTFALHTANLGSIPAFHESPQSAVGGGRDREREEREKERERKKEEGEEKRKTGKRRVRARRK